MTHEEQSRKLNASNAYGTNDEKTQKQKISKFNMSRNTTIKKTQISNQKEEQNITISNSSHRDSNNNDVNKMKDTDRGSAITDFDLKNVELSLNTSFSTSPSHAHPCGGINKIQNDNVSTSSSFVRLNNEDRSSLHTNNGDTDQNREGHRDRDRNRNRDKDETGEGNREHNPEMGTIPKAEKYKDLCVVRLSAQEAMGSIPSHQSIFSQGNTLHLISLFLSLSHSLLLSLPVCVYLSLFLSLSIYPYLFLHRIFILSVYLSPQMLSFTAYFLIQKHYSLNLRQIFHKILDIFAMLFLPPQLSIIFHNNETLQKPLL